MQEMISVLTMISLTVELWMKSKVILRLQTQMVDYKQNSSLLSFEVQCNVQRFKTNCDQIIS